MKRVFTDETYNHPLFPSYTNLLSALHYMIEQDQLQLLKEEEKQQEHPDMPPENVIIHQENVSDVVTNVLNDEDKAQAQILVSVSIAQLQHSLHIQPSEFSVDEVVSTANHLIKGFSRTLNNYVLLSPIEVQRYFENQMNGVKSADETIDVLYQFFQDLLSSDSIPQTSKCSLYFKQLAKRAYQIKSIMHEIKYENIYNLQLSLFQEKIFDEIEEASFKQYQILEKIQLDSIKIAQEFEKLNPKDLQDDQLATKIDSHGDQKLSQLKKSPSDQEQDSKQNSSGNNNTSIFDEGSIKEAQSNPLNLNLQDINNVNLKQQSSNLSTVEMLASFNLNNSIDLGLFDHSGQERSQINVSSGQEQFEQQQPEDFVTNNSQHAALVNSTAAIQHFTHLQQQPVAQFQNDELEESKEQHNLHRHDPNETILKEHVIQKELLNKQDGGDEQQFDNFDNSKDHQKDPTVTDPSQTGIQSNANVQIEEQTQQQLKQVPDEKSVFDNDD
eukprot:403367239